MKFPANSVEELTVFTLDVRLASPRCEYNPETPPTHQSLDLLSASLPRLERLIQQHNAYTHELRMSLDFNGAPVRSGPSRPFDTLMSVVTRRARSRISRIRSNSYSNGYAVCRCLIKFGMSITPQILPVKHFVRNRLR